MNFLLLVIPSLVSGRILFPFELEELQKRGGLTADAISFSSSETTTMTIETSTTTNVDTTTRQEDVESTTTTEIKAVPVCPEGEFWCDAPLEYPDQAILKAVSQQKKTFKEMFDTKPEKENIAIPKNETLWTLLETRTNFGYDYDRDDEEFTNIGYDYDRDDEEFTNICDLSTSYIRPRAAKNKDGKFRFIVNHPDGDDEYIQLVRVSTCSSAGSECGRGRLEGAGVRTRCQQEYSDHKLVSLDESGEELVVDTFSFPSCCTCLIGSDNLFL